MNKTSLVAQTVKCLPTMRETQVQPRGGEDLSEKKMAPHSSTLAWKIPWTEELGADYYCPWVRKAFLVAQMVKRLPTMRETQVQSLGWEDSLEKEMDNPLQYSCLESPTDGGAW